MIRTAVSALLLLAAAPASAASYIINAFGQLAQSAPNQSQIGGLPFSAGNAVFASWRVDLDQSPGVAIGSPGGTGSARAYPGTVRNGVIAVATMSGPVVLSQTAASTGSIFVFDNGSIPRPNLPSLRLDQVGIGDGLRFAPGPILGYSATGLAPNIIVRSVNFGRSVTTVDPVVPTLVTSAALPDLGSLYNSGPFFFSFVLLQGNPQTPAGVSGLPISQFSLINPQVILTAIPEPATWALLIIGFGMVGTALRRAATLQPSV